MAKFNFGKDASVTEADGRIYIDFESSVTKVNVSVGLNNTYNINVNGKVHNVTKADFDRITFTPKENSGNFHYHFEKGVSINNVGINISNSGPFTTVQYYGSKEKFTDIYTSQNDDNVRVSQNPDDSYQINSNGINIRLPYIAADNEQVSINTRNGNDIINIDDSVTGAVLINSGSGNNIINGSRDGRLIVEGDGNNKITLGGTKPDANGKYGSSDNIVNLGHGNNTIVANGTGQNYIGVGNGANDIKMNDGNGTVRVGNGVAGSGGNINRIVTGKGENVLITGAGNNAIDNTKGRNTIIVGSPKTKFTNTIKDTIIPITQKDFYSAYNINPKVLIVGGNDKFKEKTFEYLRTIASTPAGLKMLKQISDSGRTTTIIPPRYTNSPVNSTGREDGLDSKNFKQGEKLPQTNAVIQYNPYGATNLPGSGVADSAAIILFHELGHALGYNIGETIGGIYSSYTGEEQGKNDAAHRCYNCSVHGGIPNEEEANTTGRYSRIGPSTNGDLPEVFNHNITGYRQTENLFREQLGGRNKTVSLRLNYQALPVPKNKKDANNVTNSQSPTPTKDREKQNITQQQNKNKGVKMRM